MVDILRPQSKRFPDFDLFIRSKLPAVRKNPQVWSAFTSYSKLSDEAAAQAITFGLAPTLFVADLGGSLGYFTPAKSETITLGRSFILRFCDNPHDPALQRKLEATVLHELVHWALYGQDFKEIEAGLPVEMGELFEKAAYNNQVLARGELRHELEEDLGSISRQFESKGDPGAIGYDGTGGWSYGLYQIASKLGRMKEFLSFLAGSSDPRHTKYAQSLRIAGGDASARAGMPSFKGAWKTVAAEPAFGTAQHDFVKSTHYDVFALNLATTTGIDLATRSKALRDVAWSISVQHGPNSTGIFSKAIATLALEHRSDDKTLIGAIYDERRKVDIYFRNSSADVRAAVLHRFGKERQAALAELVA